MLDADQVAAAVRAQTGDERVSASTVHYYVKQGVLPRALGRGPGAYSPRHVALLAQACDLRGQGLSLDEVKQALQPIWNQSTPEIVQATPSNSALGAIRAAAMPQPSSPVALDAIRSAGVPRRLKFPGDWAVTCPPDATEEQIAELYTLVEQALTKHRPQSQAGIPTAKRGGRP